MAIKREIRKVANADTIVLKEAFEDFMAEKEATNKSEATLKGYRKSFKKWCDYYGEEVEATEVTQQLFFQWTNSMKLDGIRPASINHYLRDMRTVMNWCMDEARKYIPKFKVEMVTGQEEVPKFYAEEEQEALVEKPHRGADYPEWRMWAICNFVLATGARTATIINVHMGDIDFKGKKVTYHHTKNKKAQVMNMSTSLANVLKEFIRVWRSTANEDDYLFANIGNQQLTDNALRTAFRKYCLARGVSKTSIHGLRHTFARGWILNDGSMIGLQKMLGHSTLEMTRKYISYFSEDMQENFDSYNPLDNLKKSSSRRKVITRNSV